MLKKQQSLDPTKLRRFVISPDVDATHTTPASPSPEGQRELAIDSKIYVQIPAPFAVTGVILCDQLRSLDFRARKYDFICTCPDLLFQDVLRRIKPIIF